LPSRRQDEASAWGEGFEVVDHLVLPADANREAIVAISKTDKGLLVSPLRINQSDGGTREVSDDAVSTCLLTTKFGPHANFNWQSFAKTDLPLAAPTNVLERAVDVDQLNRSIVVDERYLVKWQLLARPTAAVKKLLALQTSPALTPSLDAVLTWQSSPTEEACLVATVSRYLNGATDGWVWAVDLVRSYCRGESVDAIAPFEQIGVMTAQMHSAFSNLSKSYVSGQIIEGWRSHALSELDEAKTKLADDPSRALWRHLEKIESASRSFKPSTKAVVTPIHGDYHVGQILRDPEGQLFIIDFDGNPLTELSDTQSLQPPTRDVASMYSAIDHVARVTIHRNKDVNKEAVSSWVPLAQRAFLRAYQEELSLQKNQELFESSLMALFTVQQEIREYLYAVQYLPHWVYVPDAALDAMFGGNS
jgi:maltokinase